MFDPICPLSRSCINLRFLDCEFGKKAAHNVLIFKVIDSFISHKIQAGENPNLGIVEKNPPPPSFSENSMHMISGDRDHSEGWGLGVNCHLEPFQKFIRFGSVTRPLDCYDY